MTNMTKMNIMSNMKKIIILMILYHAYLSRSENIELLDIYDNSTNYEIFDIYETNIIQIGHLYKIENHNMNVDTIKLSNEYEKNILLNLTYFSMFNEKYIGSNIIQYYVNNNLIFEKNISIIADTCIGKIYEECSYNDGCYMYNGKCIGIGVVYTKIGVQPETDAEIITKIIMLVMIIGMSSFILIASIISCIIHIRRQNKNNILEAI